jgi:hypothetical protein
MKMIRVTEVLKEVGFYDFRFVNAETLETSLHFGSAVHKATELWDRGELEEADLSAALVPYLFGWKKFLHDYKAEIIKEYIECEIVSQKWGFVGHPDRILKIKGEYGIPDIKSGQMTPANKLQTAAYKIAAEETFKIKIKFRWGVQLNEKGIPKIELYNDPTDITAFLSCLNLTNWKRRNRL